MQISFLSTIKYHCISNSCRERYATFPVHSSPTLLLPDFDPFMGETVLPLGSPSDGVSGATGAYEVVSTPSTSFPPLPTISPSTLSSLNSSLNSNTHVSPGSSFSSVFPSISLSPVTPPTSGSGGAVGRGGGQKGGDIGVTSAGSAAIGKLSKSIRGRGRGAATPASRTSLTPSIRTSLTPSFPRVSGGKPLSFIKSVSTKSIEEKKAASKAKRVKAKETKSSSKKLNTVAAAAQRRTYSKKTAE